jgi:hypothetical protein
MASVDSAGAHAAWEKSVKEQAAARGVPVEEIAKPPEDAAWFQSGHSRRRCAVPATWRRRARWPTPR